MTEAAAMHDHHHDHHAHMHGEAAKNISAAFFLNAFFVVVEAVAALVLANL